MDERRLSPWDLVFLAALAALAAYAFHAWPRLPEHLPAHWEADWRPKGWLPKRSALWFMFGLPVLTWVFIGIVGSFAVSEDALKARIQLRAMPPLRGLLCAGLAALMSLTFSIPLHGPAVFWPTIGVFAGCLILGVAFTARVVLRETPEEHRKRYRWGLLYWDPEDPRLWVEKLIGIGWTLNFAHPMAWVVLAILLLLPLGAVLGALLSH